MSLRGPSGRSGFLNWINGVIGTNFSQIEQLSDGIGYMLLLDCFLPEENVPLDRLNLDATSFEQNIRNLSVLDVCFKQHDIPKTVPIETLSRGKLQGKKIGSSSPLHSLQKDHMRFIQWFYQYLTKRYGTSKRNQEYNGVAKLTSINNRKRGKKLIPVLEEEIKKVLESMDEEFGDIMKVTKERNVLRKELENIEEITNKFPNSKDSLFVQSIIKESISKDEF